MTKFRFGLLLGFGSGYYFGAKAGRERYEQLRCAGGVLRRSGALEQAATVLGRAKAVVDLSRERVHDAVEQLPESAPTSIGQFVPGAAR